MIVLKPLFFLLIGSLLIFVMGVMLKQMAVPRLYVKKCADPKWNGVYYNTEVTERAVGGNDKNRSSDSLWVYTRIRFDTDGSVASALYGREHWIQRNQRIYRNGRGKEYYVVEGGTKVYLREASGNGPEREGVRGCVVKERVLLPFFRRPLSQQSSSVFIWEFPVTSLLTLVLCVIWFVTWNNRVDVAEVASSYESVVNRGEMWRIVSSSFSHENILHITMNVSSLLSLSFLETRLGSIPYLFLSIWFAVASQMLLMVATGVKDRGLRSDSTKVWGLGYSCVLFAWMSFCAFSDPLQPIRLFGVTVPSIVVAIPYTSVEVRISLYPFVLLVLTKLLVPNSSFLGHLCGILVGLVTLPLQRVFSAVDFCVATELAYCWYAWWRLKRLKQMSGAGVQVTNDRIGHMVNSDTNVKYTIVHNISFILLFASGLVFVVVGVLHFSLITTRFNLVFMGIATLCVCWHVKHYSREGSVAGLLAFHFVSCGTVVLQSIFSIVYVYTHEKSVFPFVATMISSASRHTEFVLNESGLIASLVAMLCLLDMMKSLSRELSFMPWFRGVLHFLLESNRPKSKYVLNGFIFVNKSKRYDAVNTV